MFNTAEAIGNMIASLAAQEDPRRQAVTSSSSASEFDYEHEHEYNVSIRHSFGIRPSSFSDSLL
jgi:hypothetical protein